MLACEKCAKARFMAVMSVAKCGHGAARGAMTYCADCAKAKNACEACGASLSGAAVPDKNDDPPPHTD